ncbi:unknown [Firmicutes bacterium CAG:460]|jgi:hypothetical protein|nr:unknown [Firmicutes bacterium CAG:460]
MKNKYYFFKRLYKDFVIIFIDKDNNMRSYEVDSILVKYIKNEDISYVSVTNDFVVDVVSRSNNRYYEYLIKELLKQAQIDL